jgi:hypothetical protein
MTYPAVVKAIPNHLIERGARTAAAPVSDGTLIEQHLEKVVIKQQVIDIYLFAEAERAVDVKKQDLPLPNTPSMKSRIPGIARWSRLTGSGRSLLMADGSFSTTPIYPP